MCLEAAIAGRFWLGGDRNHHQITPPVGFDGGEWAVDEAISGGYEELPKIRLAPCPELPLAQEIPTP